MQFTNFLGAAVIVTIAQAAPLATRATGHLVFNGAAGAQYSLDIPLDNSVVFTNNALSISSISSTTVNVAKQCTLKTVDQTPVLVEGPANTWVVGPPETVISISCSGGSTTTTPPPSTIVIEFDGADPSLGAKYSVTVPLDGSVVPTNNVLSISTLVSSWPELANKCTFNYVDHVATALVLVGNGPVKKWQVGPPQSISTVSCKA